jgi:outer membrane protein OmpA-like peptidoglycan-associated protein
MGHALAYRLSVQRARAILDYLTARGVGRDRLSAKGYGKMAPLDPGDTAIARKKNQRVEITILAAP